MKRAFCLLCILMLIFVTGCSKKEEVKIPPIKENVEYEFSADYSDMLIKGVLNFQKSGNFEITITEPQSISGLKMLFGDQNVSISYLGIKTDISSEKLPPAALGRIIADVFKAVKSMTAKISGNTAEITGNCSMGEFKLIFDKSMHPLLLSIPGFSCNIEFKKI